MSAHNPIHPLTALACKLAHGESVAPYSTMEALRVSAKVGTMQALADPRYKAWWAKRFGNGPVVQRGFDEANVHPDDPCQSKGRL